MKAVGYITVVIGCLMIAVGIVMAVFEILTKIGSNRARGLGVSPGIKSIVRCVSSFSVATVGIGAVFVLVGIAMPK
jgi:hypothetical protein